MNAATKEKIEIFLKKAGFEKYSGKDVWYEGNFPNRKTCDLTVEPPWVGISTNVQRIEAEESGLALIQDYKSMILQISSETQNEKSPDAGTRSPAPPQEKVSHSPPMNGIDNITSVTPVTSGDESYTEEKLSFICSACTTPISATQRMDSVKALGKAFCTACITQQGAEPIAPVMCRDCGFELSHVRALEYQICEGCAEKRKTKAAEKEIPLKSRDLSKEKIMNEKPEPKKIIPAGKPGANAPAAISDHERDQQIEKAKAKRYLEGQGGSYNVNGNEVPDSARIQQIANEENISVMILESQQNEEFARVRVRGILKGQSVDDEVWVDFDTELKLLMMEFIRKNEGILDHFDGLNPVFKEGAKIKNFDGSFTDAKYALVHAMLTLRKFAVRSAGTKAAKRVQMKLMNKEFREKEEIADEQAEQDLMNSKKRK